MPFLYIFISSSLHENTGIFFFQTFRTWSWWTMLCWNSESSDRCNFTCPKYCNWISQIQLDLSWKYLANKVLKLLKGVQLICCSYTKETKLYTFDIVWFPNSNSDRLVWHLNCKNVYIYKMSVLRPIVICI